MVPLESTDLEKVGAYSLFELRQIILIMKRTLIFFSNRSREGGEGFGIENLQR